MDFDLEQIYGFGPVTAAAAARQCARRNAQSVEQCVDSLRLTWMQRVGLQYHGRWRARAPRAHIRALADLIKTRWSRAGLSLKVVVCGSYRRGRSKCNDLDLLVIPSPHEKQKQKQKQKITMAVLLAPLRRGGLVPADGDLVRQPVVRYMGFCRAPHISRWFRRLDIHLTDRRSAPMALVALTGSADFNRAIRERARELGAKLSSRSLQWESPQPNEPAPGPVRTERDLFRFLGIPYIVPRLR